MDGKVLKDMEIISSTASLIIRVTMRVLGGKGGFGAMLKSLAKKSGGKKTTDFSACRDLSGRRLRHVNDEIILQKWKEAKERGEEFDPEQETKTGIDLWFLNAPSWADGFKGNGRKRYMKPRRKTRMCIDWMSARVGTEPPPGSPDWWGCPRGARCEFAHGEDDLRGWGKEAHEEEIKNERKMKENQKRDAYLGVLDEANDETMASVVEDGLRAAKRARLNEIKPEDSVRRTVEMRPSGEALPEALHSADTSTTGAKVELEEATSPVDVISNDSLSIDWLDILSGDVVTHVDGLIECADGFGTIRAKDCLLGSCSDLHESRHFQYYYEVELVTAGLFQIGWADRYFVIISSDDQGDNGIGDDNHSWAYDGFRERLWNGQDTDYPVLPKTADSQEEDVSIRWSVGDVIGCFCDIIHDPPSKISVVNFSYAINGRSLGVAFNSDTNLSLKALLTAAPNGDLGISPSITLEQGESMILNIGQRPFKHYSLEGQSSEEGIIKQSIYQVFERTRANLPPNPQTDDVILLKELQLAEERKNYNQVLKELQSEAEKKNQGDPSEQKTFDPINIESFEFTSAKDFERYGMEHLKSELSRRGLKSGGTLTERAERLFSVRGIPHSKIDKRLKAKK